MGYSEQKSLTSKIDFEQKVFGYFYSNQKSVYVGSFFGYNQDLFGCAVCSIRTIQVLR